MLSFRYHLPQRYPYYHQSPVTQSQRSSISPSQQRSKQVHSATIKMLFSKLFFLATTASAAAIKRQTVGPSPEYQVTEFIAKHDNNSPNQTISFSIQSPNTGLGPTSCSATQACPDTDTDLCQLEGTPCNLEVSFTFNRAEDTRLWYLGIGYQA